MVEKLPFGKGAYINKPPLFGGLNYQFWKVRMKFCVESIDRGILDAITNGPFVPKLEKDDVFIEKPWSQWTEIENKKSSIWLHFQEHYHFFFEFRWIFQGIDRIIGLQQDGGWFVYEIFSQILKVHWMIMKNQSIRN